MDQDRVNDYLTDHLYAIGVLVVDDDPDIREVLCQLFAEEGYPTLHAPDGQVALERLHGSPWPLVVLTDLAMPNLDGPGLLRAVLADAALRRRHTLLAMTAADGRLAPDEQRQLADLQVPILPKPLHLDEVLAAVAAAAARLQAGEGLPGTPRSVQPSEAVRVR